jgi:ubiquinone/menaquinone biosynthesis C-methylase UbiE
MTESEQRDVARAQQRRLVQNNFGAVAGAYVTSKVHASGADLAWLVEAAALTGTERVLDVATGGGHTAFALAPYAREVVALDCTRPMLEVAQREAVARELHTIRFLQGDAQDLPCEDVSFDVVTCRHAPHHFPDIDRAAREWARVLKAEGTLLLVDSISPDEEEARIVLHDIEVLRDPSHVCNHRMARWQAVLAQAGFLVAQARSWALELDVPDWTERMRTPSAAVQQIERRLRSASAAVRACLHITEHDGVLRFTLPVALILARKMV